MTDVASLDQSEYGFEIDYKLPVREERFTLSGNDDPVRDVESGDFSTYVLKVLDNEVLDDETVVGVETGTLKPFPNEYAGKEFAFRELEGDRVIVSEWGERQRNYTMNQEAVARPVKNFLGSLYGELDSFEL